jgi:hypothetical protein
MVIWAGVELGDREVNKLNLIVDMSGGSICLGNEADLGHREVSIWGWNGN